MKHKAKLLLIPLLLILVNFLFADFAHAQSVSASDFITVENLGNAAANAKLQAGASYSTNAAYQAAENAFLDGCYALGERIKQIYRGKFSTAAFISPVGFSFECQMAEVLGGPRIITDLLGTRKNRTYAVQPSQAAQNLQSSIRGSTRSVTQTTVDALDKAATEANTTKEDPTWYSVLVGRLIAEFFSLIAIILSWLGALAGWFLDFALNKTRAAVPPTLVTSGWLIVKDLMNMFFILGMIALSLATILRIEAYNYKKLLAKLILMALLINFSKAIALALMSVSDLIVGVFAPPEGLVAYGQMLASLVTEGQGLFGAAGGGAGVQEALGDGIFKVIAMLVITVSFLAIGLLVFIRLVGLWVLTVFSPVAYALNILPATSQYAKQWWTTFIKYLIWAPVAAFFLFLGKEFIREKGTPGMLQVQSPVDYIFIAALMWAAVIVAKQAGMVGADIAIKAATAVGAGLPIAAGKGLGGLGLRWASGGLARKIGEEKLVAEKAGFRAKMLQGKLEKAKTPEQKKKLAAQLAEAKAEVRKATLKSGLARVASFIDPHVVKEAWKARKHELEQRAYLPAVGHMRDTYNRIVPTEWALNKRLWQRGEFGKKTWHGLIGERAVVTAEAKEMQEGVRTREDAARLLRDAFRSGDKDEIMAAAKVVQAGNNQDDYMNLEGLTFSPTRYLNHLTEKMKERGFTKEETATFLDDLKETGEATKRIRAYGLTTQDDDGVVRAANDHDYYRTLDKEGLAKEFTRMAEKFKLAFEETGSQEFGVLAFQFDKAAKDAAKGTSFDEIAGREYGKERDDQTLGEAITQRRFMDEANVKLQRGEGHARALEAAIFVDQEVDGWKGQNLLGKMLMHELPPNVVSSVTNRIHESQGRLLYGFGGFRDKQTGKWSLPDLRVIAKAPDEIRSEPDPEKKAILEERAKAHELGFQKIKEAYRLSPKMFDAITSSSRLFTLEQRNEFKKQWNGYVRAHPSEGLDLITKEMTEGRD